MEMTNKPRIVADSKIPYLRGVLEPFAHMSYHAPSEIDNRVAREADMLIIRTRTHIDKHLLQGSPCRFIATATIGYDHIDTSYCAATVSAGSMPRAATPHRWDNTCWLRCWRGLMPDNGP